MAHPSIPPPNCERTASLTRHLRAALTPLPGNIPYDNVRPIRVPRRLDGSPFRDVVAELFPHIEPDFWQRKLVGGLIRRGEDCLREDSIVHCGQAIQHWFPGTIEPDVSHDITVLLDDDALLIVDKPAPLPTHPSGRHNRHSLIWMLRHGLDMPELRVVHRLDAQTTGIVVFAKTQSVAAELHRQFHADEIHKEYLARCYGVPSQRSFQCHAMIGKHRGPGGCRTVLPGPATSEKLGDYLPAETHFHLQKTFADGTSVIQAVPITGRTHQIRLHLWALGYPIVGDPLYRAGHSNPSPILNTLQQPMGLHAFQLTLRHPTNHQTLTIESNRLPQAQSAVPPAGPTPERI